MDGQGPRESAPVHVALLDASTGHSWAERSVRRALAADVTRYRLADGELPPPVDDGGWVAFDGVIVAGSQTDGFDAEEPWVRRTAAWVRSAVAADVPVLGICWGHLLLAEAVGGHVDPMWTHELGYASVERLADDPLFAGVGGSFRAFECHAAEVTELPAEATVLAETERALQAFRVRNAWGVQFHPEYDVDTARRAVEDARGWVRERTVDRVAATITPDHHAETAESRRVLDNFVQFVDESRRSVGARS
jgi:GMP synthase (glutamine-hydrolysing)